MFKRALMDKWAAVGPTARFTRETRADLLGVCIKTAERLWQGESADRSTFTTVFRNLGIPWRESYCESEVASPIVQSDQPLSAPEPQVRPRRWWRSRLVLAGGVVLSLAALGLSRLLDHPRSAVSKAPEPWTVGFYRILADGSDRYHRGDYDGANVELRKAVEIATEHRSPGDLSAAIRMVGDLNAERGDFGAAEANYHEALNLRSTFRDDWCRPPLLEALGDVQTKSGKFDDARISLEGSLQGYRKLHDSVGVAMAARDLGSLSFRLGNVDSAGTWFRTGLHAIDGMGKPDIVADIRGRQALVLSRLGNSREARAQLLDCLRYWQTRKHSRWIAVTECQLGQIEAEAGASPLAYVLFRNSRQSFEAVGDRAGAADAWRLMQSVSVGPDQRTQGAFRVARGSRSAIGWW